jgi:hypothetical protein
MDVQCGAFCRLNFRGWSRNPCQVIIIPLAGSSSGEQRNPIYLSLTRLSSQLCSLPFGGLREQEIGCYGDAFCGRHSDLFALSMRAPAARQWRCCHDPVAATTHDPPRNLNNLWLGGNISPWINVNLPQVLQEQIKLEQVTFNTLSG